MVTQELGHDLAIVAVQVRRDPAVVAGARRQVNMKFKMRTDLQTMTIDFADDDLYNPYCPGDT